MPGLLDIAKLQRTVQIEGFDVTVRGISGTMIAELIQRFPVISQLIFPASPVTGQPDLRDPANLIVSFPATVAAIITAGVVKVGDDEEISESAIADIPIGYQVDMLLAILEITLPGGLTPFMTKLTRLFGGNEAPVSSAPQLGAESQSATSMPNGKAPDSPSP